MRWLTMDVFLETRKMNNVTLLAGRIRTGQSRASSGRSVSPADVIMTCSPGRVIAIFTPCHIAMRMLLYGWMYKPLRPRE